MPTYVSISDADVAPEAPLTTSLLTRLRDNALAYLGAPTGTKGLFPQAAAPLGWTKDTTHNDKTLRIVTGGSGGTAGGSSAFSTVFGKTATDSFTLTLTNLPSASLTTTIGAGQGSHTHATHQSSALAAGATGQTQAGDPAGSVGDGPTVSNDVLPSMSGTTPIGGSNTSFQMGIDLRVQYLDTIVATKD